MNIMKTLRKEKPMLIKNFPLIFRLPAKVARLFWKTNEAE